MRLGHRRDRFLSLFCVCSFLCLTAVVGCGQSNSETAEAEADSLDSLLAELNEPAGGGSQTARAAPGAVGGDSAEPAQQRLMAPVSNATLSERLTPDSSGLDFAGTDSSGADLTAVDVSAAPARQLDFALGDRFPIEKQITERISDAIQGGSGSLLSTRYHMDLTVTDVTASGVMFELRYTDVQCRSEFNGRVLDWDSRTGTPAPAVFLSESGLVNNAIGFQLSLSNSVLAINGYEQFLHRCVAGYSPEQQASAKQVVGSKFTAETLADFIDETVGLIPFGETDLQVGTMLTGTRRIPGGEMISTYRVGSLTDKVAQLTVDGRLSANTASAGVVLKAGHSQGICEIDLTTGLPRSVERSQAIVLDVAQANGSVQTQNRQLRSTVRIAPRVRKAVVQTRAANSGLIQQVGAASTDLRVTTIPTTVDGAPLSSTATAVYPDEAR